MFETPLYRKVINNLPVAILIAVPASENSSRDDFDILFANGACRSLLFDNNDVTNSFLLLMRRIDDTRDRSDSQAPPASPGGMSHPRPEMRTGPPDPRTGPGDGR